MLCNDETTEISKVGKGHYKNKLNKVFTTHQSISSVYVLVIPCNFCDTLHRAGASVFGKIAMIPYRDQSLVWSFTVEKIT